jgi:hypothetical protein
MMKLGVELISTQRLAFLHSLNQEVETKIFRFFLSNGLASEALPGKDEFARGELKLPIRRRKG